MRLQASRKEGITELNDMVFERLIDWSVKRKGKLPKRVHFYRDGVSESQYDAVRFNEIPQIQIAFDNARAYLVDQASKGKCECALTNEEQNDEHFAFKLTCVAAGKRHNTRFYPLSEKGTFKKRDGFNGNVKPGLVVDQTITHPYAMDFFLQSHNPIQGTGRSAHYYVIMNYMRLTPDELQHVTHSFCYAYARATRGVSYCAPAYYADRLCDLGRAYLRHWLMNRGHEWRTRKRNKDEDEKVYKDSICRGIYNSRLWRPWGTLQKYGRERKNPWHPNLDGIMFYL